MSPRDRVVSPYMSPRGYSIPSTARCSHSTSLPPLTDRSSIPDSTFSAVYDVPTTARMWHQDY